MHKRFKRSNLNKFLGHEAVSSEVVHSHAYGQVAKTSHSLPRVRPTSSPRGQMVSGYRDSMVGSTIQYRDRTPMMPRTPESEKSTPPGENIIGNRPQSGTSEKGKVDDAPARRQHHFIEPPKPKFNRFD